MPTLTDIARLVDVFYIGGTKNGALLGEAVVILNQQLKEHFRYHMKQRGALLSKGRVLGIQFLELFTNDLFFDLARTANRHAASLTKGVEALGYEFLTPSTTNQIFPVLPNEIIASLEKDYGFYVWKKVDSQQSAIRLVTSWATTDEMVHSFLTDLKTASSS